MDFVALLVRGQVEEVSDTVRLLADIVAGGEETRAKSQPKAPQITPGRREAVVVMVVAGGGPSKKKFKVLRGKGRGERGKLTRFGAALQYVSARS